MSKAIQKMETIQAIDRAFQILETISRSGNMTLAELHENRAKRQQSPIIIKEYLLREEPMELRRPSWKDAKTVYRLLLVIFRWPLRSV